MSHSNPFARGYDSLSVQSLLLICCGQDRPLIHLPLHATQLHLNATQIERRACAICDGFALITEGQDVPRALSVKNASQGVVRALLYAVVAQDMDTGQTLRLYDSHSCSQAQQVLQRLQFETGRYSRCWEISSGHITGAAYRCLCKLADSATPDNALFIAFRIPDGGVVGVKLIATPWTDEYLQAIDGTSAEQLRAQQRKSAMPQCLIDVLHLAGRADVRMLVFDPDAQMLYGLRFYGVE